VHNFLYGNEFDLQDNERARKSQKLRDERLCTKTHFETEVTATRKKAYCWVSVSNTVG